MKMVKYPIPFGVGVAILVGTGMYALTIQPSMPNSMPDYVFWTLSCFGGPVVGGVLTGLSLNLDLDYRSG